MLFGVAEARLEQGNGLEAQGAARRAQELFRQLLGSRVKESCESRDR